MQGCTTDYTPLKSQLLSLCTSFCYRDARMKVVFAVLPRAPHSIFVNNTLGSLSPSFNPPGENCTSNPCGLPSTPNWNSTSAYDRKYTTGLLAMSSTMSHQSPDT